MCAYEQVYEAYGTKWCMSVCVRVCVSASEWVYDVYGM